MSKYILRIQPFSYLFPCHFATSVHGPVTFLMNIDFSLPPFLSLENRSWLIKLHVHCDQEKGEGGVGKVGNDRTEAQVL